MEEIYKAGEYKVVLSRVIAGLWRKWKGEVFTGSVKVFTVEEVNKAYVINTIVDKVVAVPFSQWQRIPSNGE